jgi:hypothetical protein
MGKQIACMQELFSQYSLCYRQLFLEYFCCGSLTQSGINAATAQPGWMFLCGEKQVAIQQNTMFATFIILFIGCTLQHHTDQITTGSGLVYSN